MIRRDTGFDNSKGIIIISPMENFRNMTIAPVPSGIEFVSFTLLHMEIVVCLIHEEISTVNTGMYLNIYVWSAYGQYGVMSRLGRNTRSRSALIL